MTPRRPLAVATIGLKLASCGVSSIDTGSASGASSTPQPVAPTSSVVAQLTSTTLYYPPPPTQSLEPALTRQVQADAVTNLAQARIRAPSVSFLPPSGWPEPSAVDATSVVADPGSGRTEGNITLYYANLSPTGTVQVSLTSDALAGDKAAQSAYDSLVQPVSGRNPSLHASLISLSPTLQAVELGDGHIDSVIVWLPGRGNITVSGYSGKGVAEALTGFAAAIVDASRSA